MYVTYTHILSSKTHGTNTTDDTQTKMDDNTTHADSGKEVTRVTHPAAYGW